jgi:hypothetical protein
LTGEPADAAREFVFTTTVGDRLFIPTVDSSGNTIQLQVRLNAFFNQYLSNFYWSLDYDPATNVAANPYHLAYAAPQSQMELVVDGRKIMIWKGVDTDAKKLAMLDDFSGDVCLPGYAPALWGVGSSLPGYATGTQYGLTNPNTGVLMNGTMSYGCIKIEQFVQIDLSVYYSFLGTGGSYDQPCFLNYFAEVLRSYNKDTDTVAFLTERRAQVEA